MGNSLRCQLGESFPPWISTFLRKAFTWALRLPGLGCLERKVVKGVELYPSHPPVVSPVRFCESKSQCIFLKKLNVYQTIFRHLKIEVQCCAGRHVCNSGLHSFQTCCHSAHPHHGGKHKQMLQHKIMSTLQHRISNASS